MARTDKQIATEVEAVGTLAPQLALPAEIINIIIDDLGYNTSQPASIGALRACALASKALCMRAYHYLFSEIKLTIFPSSSTSTPPKRLLDVLVTGLRFPGLGMVYYIRSMSLVLELDFLYCYRDNSISKDTAFPRILDALHGPNHGISSFALEIGLQRQEGYSLRLLWSSNGTEFNTAFQSLCQSRNLTSLRLKSFDVPTTLLHGSNIEYLSLDNVILDRHPEEPFSGPVIQPRSIALLRENWSLNNLLDLLHNNAEPTMDRKGRFQLAFAHLTDLTLTAQWQSADLRQMPRLHSLRLVQPKYFNIPPRILHPVNEFFSFEENTFPFSLVHLTIDIKTRMQTFTGEAGRILTQESVIQWNAFDSHLAGSRFHNIHDIHLAICYVFFSGGDPPPSDEAAYMAENKEVVLSNLPLLVASRPTTFLVDIVVDQLKDLRNPNDIGKPGVSLRGTHSGWW